MSARDAKTGETFVMSDPGKPIDFSTFLLGLASSALIHLGEAPNPESGERQVDLTLARQTLDLLGMLKDKTRGNLSADEEKLLEGLLADLRLRFVQAQKH